MPKVAPLPATKTVRGPGTVASKGRVPAHGAYKTNPLTENSMPKGLKRNNKSFKEQHLVDPRAVTPAQRDVIEAIAKGETPYAAAKIAGINPPYVYTFLKRPYIQELIAERKALFAEASKMTRQKVMDGMLEGIEMAKMMSEPASMISGWREIGKMCGFYEPVRVKLDVNVSGNVVMQRMNELSDAELLKLIQEGPQALNDVS